MRLNSTKLLAIVLIFSATQALAYLFTGLSIKVDTFAEKPIDGLIVFIELCKGKMSDKNFCLNAKEQIDCKKNNQNETISGVPYQWDCLTKEIFPFRFGIKYANNKFLYASDSFVNTQDSTRDRYALDLKNNKIEPIYIPAERRFYIGLQTMLENVFHSSVVQKIRELDKKNDRKSWHTIGKTKTSFILKVCEIDKCETGRQQDLICSLSTIGTRGIAYQCNGIPSYARFAEVTINGHDKIRKSNFFPMLQKANDAYYLNYINIKTNVLELSSGQPPS